MLTTTVDLTRLCAVKEIQHILKECDGYRGVILQNPCYKQQLIEYVLSNINHRYLEIQNLTEIPKDATDILPQCPIEEKIAIRQLLHIGILEIIQTSNHRELKSA